MVCLCLSRRNVSLFRAIRWFLGHGFVRRDFDRIYRRAARDAWGYGGDDFTHKRYQVLLEELPKDKVRKVLEVGCAEGHLTRLLARHVQEIFACDISEIAIGRAMANCADLGNIRFAAMDIRRDIPRGDFDLILYSDVLYYLAKKEVTQLLRDSAMALREGAFLMFSNEWHPRYRFLLSPASILEAIGESRCWEKMSVSTHDMGGKKTLTTGLFRRSSHRV